MRNIFISSLIEKAKEDSRIVLITADLGFGVVEKFSKEFPDRFFNTGITEQSTMSLAAGLASTGYRPFVYSIANFPTFRAMEQIRNDIHYMQLGVTIVALGEGFSYGTAGYSHHLIEDISSFRAFDSFRIFSPTGEFEVKQSVSKILSNSEPALLRLGRMPEIDYVEGRENCEFDGFSTWTKGTGVSIIFHGGIADEVLGASKLLKDEGVDVSIYSCYQLNSKNIRVFLENHPFEKLVVVVEEHVKSGGLGSIFLETANENEYQTKVLRIAVEQINREFVGNQTYLRDAYGLNSDAIAEKVLRYLSSS